MSIRALVIILAVVVALGALVAALTLTGPGHAAPADADPLLAFAPSEVVALEIRRPGDPAVQRAERTPAGWRLTVTDNLGAERAWPLQSAQVRGLLAVLARATPAADTTAASIVEPALTLALTLGSGEPRTLTLDARAVGGRRLAQAGDAPPVYLDTPIYEALTQPGPMGWRDTRVFDTAGADTARVRLAREGAPPIELARLGQRWSVRGGIRAPADPDAVQTLITTLTALRVARWLDADPPPGAFDGAVTVTIERDARTLDPAGQPRIDAEAESVIIGADADVNGEARFIRLGDAGAVGIAASADLAPALAPVERFLSRRPTPIDASVVAAIAVWAGDDAGTVVLRRTLDGWREGDSNTDASPRAAVILDLLTTREASSVAVRAGPDPGDTAEPARSIELLGFDGGVIAAVRAVQHGADLFIDAGAVRWRYADTALPF